MRRFITSFAFALGCMDLAVNAQETRTKTETRSSGGDPQVVTYTGCVQTGTQAKTFVLDKVAVTYAQASRQHVVVEFSFDIVHAIGGAYLPDAFKWLIGFRVATPLLERAFRETYGLEMRDLFANQDRAIATYRYAVSQIFPALTEAAWRDKHDEIAKLTPAIDRSAFVSSYPRPAYEAGSVRSSRWHSKPRHRKPPNCSRGAFATRRPAFGPRSTI
jgi:hypothetical protein